MQTPVTNEKTTIIYGKHPCIAALLNPDRKIYKLMVTKKNSVVPFAKNRKIFIEFVTNDFLDKFLKTTIHQGTALISDSTQVKDLNFIISKNLPQKRHTIVIPDEVTDVGNIGAIIRSMACFNAKTLGLSSATLLNNQSTLSKVSGGAIEHIDITKITNTSTALNLLKKHGYSVYSLDCSTETTLNEIPFKDKCVIVPGNEHSGVKQSTRSISDFIVKVTISEKFNSLNVATATSIVLYEIFKKQKDNDY